MEKTFGELIGEMAMSAAVCEELQEKLEQGKLVEVVRCKDCRWYHGDNGTYYQCDINRFVETGLPRTVTDFCSYGLRRE
ncbi:MAG: hypothetical protein LLG05_18890 [Porphyromonadaceae bacterium]|nr:hypothetical protein [Porphyromonadaceae bacterium]